MKDTQKVTIPLEASNNDLTYYNDMNEMYEQREQDTLWLIMALVEHTEGLREEIIKLRQEVNSYERELRKAQNKDISNYQERYINIISDIYMDFSGFAAYELYREAFGDTED